eukprot:6190103-Pleurochrysis_carterae.AAC.2
MSGPTWTSVCARASDAAAGGGGRILLRCMRLCSEKTAAWWYAPFKTASTETRFEGRRRLGFLGDGGFECRERVLVSREGLDVARGFECRENLSWSFAGAALDWPVAEA